MPAEPAQVITAAELSERRAGARARRLGGRRRLNVAPAAAKSASEATRRRR